MKNKKFLYGIRKIREDINKEAEPKPTAYSSHVKKVTLLKETKGVLLVVAIIIAMLLMAAAYAIIRHYVTPIENTKLYYYSDDDKSSEINVPEKAAYELAVLFMEDLQAEDEARTFRITEYKD